MSDPFQGGFMGIGAGRFAQPQLWQPGDLNALARKTLPDFAGAAPLQEGPHEPDPILDEPYVGKVLGRVWPSLHDKLFPDVADAKAENEFGFFNTMNGVGPQLEDIARLRPNYHYDMNGRLSDMVEDRRPTSIWSPYPGQYPPRQSPPPGAFEEDPFLDHLDQLRNLMGE